MANRRFKFLQDRSTKSCGSKSALTPPQLKRRLVNPALHECGVKRVAQAVGVCGEYKEGEEIKEFMKDGRQNEGESREGKDDKVLL
jgi:hypothetical protein